MDPFKLMLAAYAALMAALTLAGVAISEETASDQATDDTPMSIAQRAEDR